MSIDTPPRVPGPPKPDQTKPAAVPPDNPAPSDRRLPKAALAGAAPLGLGVIETVGVNYGTTGLIVAGAVTAAAIAAPAIARRFAPGFAARVGLRKPGRVSSPPRGNGIPAPRGGGRRSGLRSLFPGGRRTAVGRGTPGGGGRGKGRGLGRLLPKGHGAGKATRSLLGGKGRQPAAGKGTGPRGAGLRLLGKGKAAVARAAGRSRRATGGGGGKPAGSSRTRRPAGGTGRGGLGRLPRKRRGWSQAGRSAGTGSRGRGLLGRKSGGTGGRPGHGGLFGKRRSPSHAGGGRKPGGLAVKRAARSARRSSTRSPGATRRHPTRAGGQSRAGARRPQSKAQRKKTSIRIPDPRASWKARWEQSQADRRYAGGALTAAEHANSGMQRQPIPQPHPQPTTPKLRNTPKGRKTMPNPFEAAEEAMNSTPAIEVENARTVMDFNEHAPQFAETHAAFWRKNNDAIREGLPISPEYGDALDNMNSAMGLYAEDVKETGEVWKRAHEEKLHAIEDPLPNAHKWDILLNKD